MPKLYGVNGECICCRHVPFLFEVNSAPVDTENSVRIENAVSLSLRPCFVLYPWRTFELQVITKMGNEATQSAIRAAMADMVNAVTALRQSGHGVMAEALKNLAERISGCALPPQDRQDLIENVQLAIRE